MSIATDSLAAVMAWLEVVRLVGCFDVSELEGWKPDEVRCAGDV